MDLDHEAVASGDGGYGDGRSIGGDRGKRAEVDGNCIDAAGGVSLSIGGNADG